MIKGIIFDMDGVLVETESLQCRSYIEALKKFNIAISEEFYIDFWTRQGKRITDFIRENSLDLDPDKVRSIKKEIYHKLLKKQLKAYEGAKEKLQELSRKYPLALVTDAYRDDAGLILEITKIGIYFKAIVTGSDVKALKPNPEGFLTASNRLGILPQHILVIEDSEKGINAAKSAGMKSIAVPNKYTSNNDFSNADKIVDNIKSISQTLVRSL